MRWKKPLFLVLPCLLAWTLPARGDLIVNGGFETGNFNGWTQSGNPAFSGVDNANPHAGTFAAYFGATSLGFIAQTVATAPGAEYQLRFWLNNQDSVPANQFQVLLGGNLIVNLSNLPASGYQQTVINFFAAGPLTEVKFGFRHDVSFFDFDDVSLNRVEVVVPTPAGLVLMLPGFVGIGVVHCIRKRKLKIADATS